MALLFHQICEFSQVYIEAHVCPKNHPHISIELGQGDTTPCLNWTSLDGSARLGNPNVVKFAAMRGELN
jgi:REP element-mobilizing transposase RayT